MPQSSYDEIASEYYDDQHITSRNFDATTVNAIASLAIAYPHGKVLELGAGKGRAGEFLRIEPNRVVQLDNSQAMFDLPAREDCLVKVVADACRIPLASRQFDVVVGFLADPFFGLASISEAYRVLNDRGQLFLTLPTYDWAIQLRTRLSIDVMTTRFRKIGTEEIVVLPSLVHKPERVGEMLALCGFRNIEIKDHSLPATVASISPDIRNPAQAQDISPYDLPIIHTVRAIK